VDGWEEGQRDLGMLIVFTDVVDKDGVVRVLGRSDGLVE
jgi:aspartyl-tRNA synthetase